MFQVLILFLTPFLANQMTITERNQMQFRLRKEMYYHAQQADWCREQILSLNREFKEQDLNLAKEMFNAN